MDFLSNRWIFWQISTRQDLTEVGEIGRRVEGGGHAEVRGAHRQHHRARQQERERSAARAV